MCVFSGIPIRKVNSQDVIELPLRLRGKEYSICDINENCARDADFDFRTKSALMDDAL